MRNISFAALAAVIFLSGCQQSFKKGDKGLEYKIISDGKGKKLEFGKFMQFHLAQFYNNGKKDSLLNDTRTTGSPMIEMLDSANLPMEIYKICAQLRKGDSMILRISTDTIIKQQNGQVPPFIKKGNYYVQTLRILNVFDDRAQADSARKAEFDKAQVAEKKKEEELLVKDEKTIQDYLKKNNIKASRAAEGTYVEIIREGTGPKVDTTVFIKVNYTGRTMKEGTVFDSNTDSAFNHVAPFSVNMTNDYSLGNGVIKGWKDGILGLNKGAQARLFIPSGLAYGSRGAGEKIPADAILIFDVEVLDLMSVEQARAEAKAEQAKMDAMRQRYMDSVKKARPDTAALKVDKVNKQAKAGSGNNMKKKPN